MKRDVWHSQCSAVSSLSNTRQPTLGHAMGMKAHGCSRRIFFSLNHQLLNADSVTAPLTPQPQRGRGWGAPSIAAVGAVGLAGGREQQSHAWGRRVGLCTFTRGCQSTRWGKTRPPAGKLRSHVRLASSEVRIYLLCHLLGLSSVVLELEEKLFRCLLGCCSSCLLPKKEEN